jgi:ElaB/YqjD/DUF883 family membrane-anchored ribosome-binding protein
MSDEYQQFPKGQDKQQPGEQEEMERGRKEREAAEKRIRGGERTRAASASEYGGTSSGASEYGSVSSDASEYGRRISEVASQAKDYVSDRVSVVGDKFKELQSADLGEFAEYAKEYARQKPGQALLISAAAGFLLGLIIRGRR